MPIWLQGIETKFYQALAKIAATQLSKCTLVRGVYARRSVACGEVVFGRSDIDLHLLIEPLPDVHAEARFLRDFAIRYAGLKRLLPCLADCEISTGAELERWYQSRPYTWHRDRGWLRLYGEDFQRPVNALLDGGERDSLLWWFFWAWERLPDFYRAGNLRTCCNLFLDMVNAYGLYVGDLHVPQRRSELLQYWLSLGPVSRKHALLNRGFHRGFRGLHRVLLPWLYGEGLKLCDTLYSYVAHKLEGQGCGTEVHVRTPFSFSPRTYLVVDPWREADLSSAVAVMERNTQVVVATEKTLKLYLYHRNPWEYYSLQANCRPLPFSPPPEEAVLRVIRFALHKEGPRKAGLSVGRKRDRSRTVGAKYAQCKLYAEGRSVATNPEDLCQQYQQHYGAWPYAREASSDAYFLYDYPVVCQTIEEISQQETFRRMGSNKLPTGVVC